MNIKNLYSLAVALVASQSVFANDYDVTLLQSSPKETEIKVPMATYATSDALYAMPAVLANLGTHTTDNVPVCNMLARHKAINDGAFLWAPLGSEVVYFDQSSNNPTSWQWNIPGGNNEELDTQNAAVKYNKAGLYDMPTLTVTTANGESSFTPTMSMTSSGGNEKIKTGGTVEITTSDMRVHGQVLGGYTIPQNATYSLGAMSYGENQGFLGGVNTKDIKGWGNLFMVGQDDSYLDAINIYFYKKPTKYIDGARLTVQVWMPTISDNYMILTGIPLNGGYLYYTDIKSDGEDGAWAMTYDGAVGQITLDTPIDLYGKPYFFISVEGFSNDPTTDDLCLLTDLMGKEMNEEQMSNMLSHNSFARMNGESDYMRPVSSYGGGSATFMICPVIRSGISEAGIEDVKTDNNDNVTISVSGKTLNVTSNKPDKIDVFDLTGKNIVSHSIEAGENNINLNEVKEGIYVVKNSQGNAKKIILR